MINKHGNSNRTSLHSLFKIDSNTQTDCDWLCICCSITCYMYIVCILSTIIKFIQLVFLVNNQGEYETFYFRIALLTLYCSVVLSKRRLRVQLETETTHRNFLQM